MEFRLLGPLEAREGGREVLLGGPRQRAVLAILLTRAGEVVPQERLVDELWGEEPPETAVNTLHGYVSHLRRALGSDVIVSRAGGYVLRVEPGELDLRRFERLAEEGRQELESGHAERAATALRAALALWRGPALADFAGEAFARAETARLEELRLAVLERRLEADLALGRHLELVGELEALVAEHPFREGPRALLMLALYRSGRQTEALEVYRDARGVLVERLGVEPGPALRKLEQAILRQDPGLDAAGADMSDASRPDVRGTIVAAARQASALDALVPLAGLLAGRPARELVVVHLVGGPAELGPATAALAVRRSELAALGVEARVAAHTSSSYGEDAVLLAKELDAALLLVHAPPALLERGIPDPELQAVLSTAPCDVGVLVPPASARGGGGPVAVPFAGSPHDWSAVELGAWAARSLGVALRLVGTSAEPGWRDASRLLAHASLVVQAAVGIVAEPALVPDEPTALAAAVRGASLLVVPVSERWQAKGLGPVRLELARSAGAPTLLVRSGLRPGGLAPGDGLTRFTWTLAIDESV